MNIRETKLREILDHHNGEGDVHKFLEIYPEVLAETLVRGNTPYVVSKFELGNEFITDFVVAEGFSGGWFLKLVELEPPKELLFNKDETPKQRFKEAITQLDNWKVHINKNKKYFLFQLSKAIKERELLIPKSRHGRELTDSVGWKTTDR